MSDLSEGAKKRKVCRIVASHRDRWPDVIFRVSENAEIEIEPRLSPDALGFARPAKGHVLLWAEGQDEPQSVDAIAMLRSQGMR